MQKNDEDEGLTREYVLRVMWLSFMEARKGKQATSDEYNFEMQLINNFTNLVDEVMEGRYATCPGTAFISHDPVDREIFAARFRDRIIHHFICYHIMPWWERHWIHACYSCRKGKGTDFGRKDFYEKIRRKSRGYLDQETYVVKIDISSYFCSINHQKLYKRVRWGLERQYLAGPEVSRKDQELFDMLDYLVRIIIFDDPTVGVRRKGSQSDWDNYPKRKSLFWQEDGVGIVIGNLTSQVFSNIFLDILDHFVLNELGIKFYGRYVDDAYFILSGEEKKWFFAEGMPKLEKLLSEMGLTLNPRKTVCRRIDQGIEFLGAVFYPYRIIAGKRLKEQVHKMIYNVETGQKPVENLVSVLGVLQHYDSQKMIAKEFEKYGLDYILDSKNGPSAKFFTEGN